MSSLAIALLLAGVCTGVAQIISPKCRGEGRCADNATSMLQSRREKNVDLASEVSNKIDQAPTSDTEVVDLEWKYDGDTVEGKLTGFVDALNDDNRGELYSTKTLQMMGSDNQTDDLLNGIGNHIAKNHGMLGSVWRGCLHFVNDLVMRGETVPDYGGSVVDKFVEQCKKGVFVETQQNPVPVDEELKAECDRTGELIRSTHRLNPTAFDSPRRFCTSVVTGILPLESEPACMRFIEDINARFFLTTGQKDLKWPNIISDVHFDESFMQACRAGSLYLVADDADCQSSLASLKSTNLSFHPANMKDLYGHVCPALGLPVPVPPGSAYSKLTARSHSLLHFGKAARSDEVQNRSASIGHKLQVRQSGHSMSVTKLMDQSLTGKGGGAPPRRRRRRYDESHRICCEEQALTHEISLEASALFGAGVSTGHAHGWSSWKSRRRHHGGHRGWPGQNDPDDTVVCNYKTANTVTTCIGADVGAGFDLSYDQGVFYKYDHIPGESCFHGFEISFYAGAGYSKVRNCDTREQIGYYVSPTGGFTFAIEIGTCNTAEIDDHAKGTHEVKFHPKQGLYCNENCFPAGSIVQTPSGIKKIEGLRVGEKVLTIGANGKLMFEDIYFFGHAQYETNMSYIKLNVQSLGADSEAWEMFISPDHFMITCPRSRTKCDWTERISRYAASLSLGDIVWVHSLENGEDIAGTLLLARIVGMVPHTKQGKYNPYTLSGLIIVDGIVASAHSSWVLDSWTPTWLAHHLPSIYQALFLPGRLLYTLAGARAADWLDMNNPQEASSTFGHGPKFLLCVLVAMAGTIASAFKFSKGVRLGTKLPQAENLLAATWN